MKNLMKVCLMIFAVAAISLSLSSCNKELCYECLGFDDGTTSLEDVGTICEGDSDGLGGTYTKTQLKAQVALYEGFGGTCSKK